VESGQTRLVFGGRSLRKELVEEKLGAEHYGEERQAERKRFLSKLSVICPLFDATLLPMSRLK
jgi:hypothetical protein